MKKFKVQVYWQLSSTLDIEAETLEQAFQKAREYNGLPTDSDYVSDSFEVDEEVSDMMNSQDN